MTFSILAFDQKTGTYGAAAATGSLCVGGWVLRGSLQGGLVASQGTAPSTLWRDHVLKVMEQGTAAEKAVESTTQADLGRAHRQIIALDAAGNSAAFTGLHSVAWAGHLTQPRLACAGNMIKSKAVLDAMSETYLQSDGRMADRLLSALVAAERAGGDSRGLLSAALLVLSADAPPMDLRIDHHEQPVSALQSLLTRAQTPPYADWLHEVPVASDPMRAPVTLAESRP